MLKIFLLLFVILAPAHTHWLPKRRSQPHKTDPPQIYFPPELRRRGQKAIIDLKIPNKQFCAEMQLQPERQYMVLPWWYHYCQKFDELKEKKYMNSPYFIPTYKNILHKVNMYKNLKYLSDQRMRDLKNFEIKHLGVIN